MDHRFETFSLSILELNRYLQKIKELEMKQFGLKANHTMCLYYRAGGGTVQFYCLFLLQPFHRVKRPLFY